MAKAKYNSGGSLKDNETRLTTFDKLSPAKQAELREAAQKRVNETDAERKPGFGARLMGTLTDLNPVLSEKSKQQRRDMAAEETRIREERYNDAKRRAEELGNPKSRALYEADKPQKIGSDLFKKGGAVKGWGKARGARAAKVY
jgi:hypothetical protein